MLWTARTISPADLDRLEEQGHRIRHEYDAETPEDLNCHCVYYTGPRR